MMSVHKENIDSFFRNSLEVLFRNSTNAIVLFDEKHIVVDINQSFENLFGYKLSEIKGRDVDEVMNTGWDGSANRAYTKEILEGRNIEGEGVRFNRSGKPIDVIIKGIPIIIDGSLRGGYGIYVDITEIKRAEKEVRLNEKRLQKFLDIFEYKSESIQDLLDFALEQAIELTGSKIGYILYYDEEHEEFNLNSHSKDVMSGCMVEGEKQRYQLAGSGIWGEAVRQRKPIIVNKYSAPNDLKKGYPEGHVNLLNFLTVPVFSTGKIVAVIGVANKEIDYTQTDVLQLTLLMDAVWKMTERKQIEQEIQQSREWYRTLAENIPALVVRLSPDLNFTYANSTYCQLYGRGKDKIIGYDLFQFVQDDMQARIKKAFRELTVENPTITYEHSLETQPGSVHWIRWVNRALFNDDQTLNEYLCVGEDITETKQAEDDLRSSENRNRALISAIPDMLFRFNHEGVCLDAEIKYSRMFSLQYHGISDNQDLIGKKIKEILPPEPAALLIAARDKAIEENELQIVEFSYPSDGKNYIFEARLINAGGGELVSIVRDVTERKHFEDHLKYLSLHDHLTGLNNRAYFENELERLDSSREYPISIISIDLDGIKMINDTLGHAVGDELIKACASVLKKTMRYSDIVARVGGDEFSVILPQTTNKEASEIIQRLHLQADLYSRNNRELPLSMSIGIATAESNNKKLGQTYVEADDSMYHQKLHKGIATKTYLIDALIDSLDKKDCFDQGHGERMESLCRMIGEKVGLSAKQLEKLKQFVRVHDLGKVGITDAILFKEGPLSEEEWKIVQQHPEKGYRIALFSNNLKKVADLILKHHEHWDGTGYPLGLKGEEIPLECRILAIADTFDVMTTGRSYRETLTFQDTLAEIENCSGRQFDPALVNIFLSMMGKV